MKFIRWLLGKAILAYDRAFVPTSVERNPIQQQAVQSKLMGLELYQLVSCPFCVKVRRELKRLGIELPLRNVEDPVNQAALMKGGKRDQVPCLKIPGKPDQWLYESDDIIRHLRQKTS